MVKTLRNLAFGSSELSACDSQRVECELHFNSQYEMWLKWQSKVQVLI
ncbi:MAG: hypothetical protein ACOC07_18030 [Coleofasciculus sp.]